MNGTFTIGCYGLYIILYRPNLILVVRKQTGLASGLLFTDRFNTRSASGASLPECANSGQIDRRVVYCLLIYIMLCGEGKYLKIIIYHHLVIYFVMFYTYDVSNRSIPGNIANNE